MPFAPPPDHQNHRSIKLQSVQMSPTGDTAGTFKDLIEALKKQNEEEVKFGMASSVLKYSWLKPHQRRAIACYRMLPRNKAHIVISRHDLGPISVPRKYITGEPDPILETDTVVVIHQHKKVKKTLSRFWRACLTDQGRNQTDEELVNYLNKREYTIMYARMVRATRKELFPFNERVPAFTKDDVYDAIKHHDFPLETANDDLAKQGKFQRHVFERKILEICDLYTKGVDGVDYLEYMKALYKLLFPKKVREMVFSATHARPTIEIKTSCPESVDRAKMTINKWVRTFNSKSLPYVHKIHDHIHRKKLSKIPKPDLSYAWTEERKIVIGSYRHEGNARKNIVKTGGGGRKLKLDTKSRKGQIAFLNSDVRFKTYADSRMYKRKAEYHKTRTKPSGLGARCTKISKKKMLVPDEEVPAFQLSEVEEISFTDGKSIHPYPTITIGLSHRADFDGNENVLIQSEKLKMRTTAKILFLLRFRSDEAFLQWKRLLNIQLGDRFEKVFMETKEMNKFVASRNINALKRSADTFFDNQNKKSEYLYEKQGQEVQKMMQETDEEVKNIMEETQKMLHKKFLSKN
eukprot:g12235.t1